MRALLFSAGPEHFAAPLASVSETVDSPRVHPVPGSDEDAPGVIDLRGRRVPAYAPSSGLNLRLEGPAAAALIIGEGESAIALLVSEVHDVLDLDAAEQLAVPGGVDAAGVVVGVVNRDGKLISVVDMTALRDACRAARARR